MDKPDPIDTFRRLFAAFRKFAEREPEFVERARRQRQLYEQMARAEPASLRRELERLHAGPGLSPEFSQHILDLFNEIPPLPSEDQDFAFCPPASEFFSFVSRSMDALSADVVHELLGSAIRSDAIVLRASVTEAMRADDSISFESRVRALSEALRNAAENWYKPVLGCALSISYRGRGRARAVVPNELGALMAACRDSKQVPESILVDQIRMIRNATAHSSLQIDLDASTIVYVNENRRGAREQLGPLTWLQLTVLADEFSFLCSSLTLVCRKHYRLTAPGPA